MSKNIDEEELRIRREKVKKLYNEGKSGYEIADILFFSRTTISKDINYLIDQGEMTRKEKAIGRDMEARRAKRREYVAILYNEGKTREEIAEQTHFSIATIKKDIDFLISENIIQQRETIKVEKKQETIKRPISAEKAKELCVKFYGQVKVLNKLNEYVSDCRQKYAKNKLKKEEVEVLREVVLATNNYKDVVFYINLCIDSGDFGEAIKFINGQVNNENFTVEQKNRIKSMQQRLKQTIKTHKAKKILEQGLGVQEAIKQSGLSELEVIKINKELLKANEKNNNSSEEQIR